MPTHPSRRHFLRSASGAAVTMAPVLRHLTSPMARGLAGLAALAAQSSHAADTANGYRALVCVYLTGGNDSHNWIVPTDTTGYAEYAAARRELAWPLTGLQPITVAGQGAGRSFGMPSELAPLRKWYESGQAAILANVGTLVRPTTRADYLAGLALPSRLFSHNDQMSAWQSLSPEGARSGWGGRMGDILMSANAYPVFTTVSATGNAVYLSGSQVTQYMVGPDGPARVDVLNSGSLFSSTRAPAAVRNAIAATSTDPLRSEYSRVLQRGVEAGAVLQRAMATVNVPAIPANQIALGSGGAVNLSTDSLARQLRLVAQTIGAAQTLGMRRQVFMVSMGGFDSHSNQMRDQPSQMARVAQSLDYFLTSLAAMGLLNNVTLFTASDFGRTLLSNGDGSDHGWGSHHFVAGGAVRGRNIYGQFPVTALGHEQDIGSGRLLPSSSVIQVAARLGGWMGLTANELRMVLPGVDHFDAQALPFI